MRDSEDEAYAGYQTRTASHYNGIVWEHMDKVQTPLLIVHARDDPVVSHETLNLEQCHQNNHIITMTTKRGGHLGFHEGVLPFGLTWADRVHMRYISAVLEVNSQHQFNLQMVFRVLRQLQTSNDVNVTQEDESSESEMIRNVLSSDSIARMAASLPSTDRICGMFDGNDYNC